MDWLPDYNIILASKSPRRQELLASLGIQFSVKTKEVDEVYPQELAKEEVAVYLAELKAKAFQNDLNENDLLITADTIVCLAQEILGKPADYKGAYAMLEKLSGRHHEVITGVCLTTLNKSVSFFAQTDVQFKTLTHDEIDYYIREFSPYDKAGSYGIQEWIGAIGITNINGSFYNVMGVPVQKLYQEILNF